MKTDFSPESRRDLLDIALYIVEDNPERATSFADELEAKCHSLTDFPEAHPVFVRRRGRSFRKAVYGNYLIFYEVRPNLVWIVRILHGARNLRRLL